MLTLHGSHGSAFFSHFTTLGASHFGASQSFLCSLARSLSRMLTLHGSHGSAFFSHFGASQQSFANFARSLSSKLGLSQHVLSQELVEVTAGAAAGAASAPATHAVVKSKKAAFTNQHLHIETYLLATSPIPARQSRPSLWASACPVPLPSLKVKILVYVSKNLDLALLKYSFGNQSLPA